MIHFTHVTKSYEKDWKALNNVTFRINKGEFVFLTGHSGAGKSTVLKLIYMDERPDEERGGQVMVKFTGDTVYDSKTTPEKKIQALRRKMGIIFQDFKLLPDRNVFDNVAYPLTIKKVPKAEIRQSVDRVLAIVHLSQYAQRFPNQLSGGQQQRVALARALVAAPKLLLLDEPLSNLDAKLRESMRFEIKEIQRELGITVVYVTHDQTEAMAMSDRIFLINRGVVQQSGTPQQIYNEPANQFVMDFLGKVDFFKGVAENGRITFPEMGNQSIAYDGPRKGPVEVAVRPENLYFCENGVLQGKLEAQYYLGDVDDCRVRVGDTLVRVIANGHEFQDLTNGQPVSLGIRDFRVFEDNGLLEQMLQIQT